MDKRKLRVLLRHRSAMAGLAVVVALLLLALVIGWVSPHDPTRMDSKPLQAPSGSHWFGTDDTGRDVFTRIGYGGRVSLAIGLAAVLVSLAIGVPLGAF